MGKVSRARVLVALCLNIFWNIVWLGGSCCSIWGCSSGSDKPSIGHYSDYDSSDAQGKSRPRVLVMRSPASLKTAGWKGKWEFAGCLYVLDRLGVSYRVIGPAELKDYEGGLLILANARNLENSALEESTRFVKRGGKILATYMTSFRREDNTPWQSRDFALSDLLGVTFKRWVGKAPMADALVSGDSRPIWLGRNHAMLVKPHKRSKVLAYWHRPQGEPAIVETQHSIYVGEDLFAPENCAAEDVVQLAAELMERLSPGVTGSRRNVQWPEPEPDFLPLRAVGPVVRIGLNVMGGELLLKASRTVRWREGSGREVVIKSGESGEVGVYSAAGKKLFSSSGWLGFTGVPYLEVYRFRPNGSFRWYAFRGTLLVTTRDGHLICVNKLPLEWYLAGVVPSEVPYYFPKEALKAMAVVARTYTLSHLGRHKEFDLCSTVHCQVYKGLLRESSATSRAVQATRGEVVRYRGRLCDTPFFAVCGGAGASAGDVWLTGSSVPYLRGTVDTVSGKLPTDAKRFIEHPEQCYCETASRFRWEERYSWQQLQSRIENGLEHILGDRYHGLGTLRALEVKARTELGRVKVLRVVGSKSSYDIYGDRIRWLFSGGKVGGVGALNSTFFYVGSFPGGVRIRGGGWGHGVGLCQEGAAGRAAAGWDYQRILRHYYSGTKVVKGW